MPETGSLEILFKGIEESAVGKASGEAGKSTAEDGEDRTEKKNKKGMLKSVVGVAASVLGIQLSFAAMLRQSQIATGFFGAIFQVLGAILDSFLLAFAPALFQIVERLASFIPAAREVGEQIAGRVGDLWTKLEEWAMIAVPLLTKIGSILAGIHEWFSELSPIFKYMLGALLVIPRLYTFFKVGFWLKGGQVIQAKMAAALAVHRLKSAAMGGGAGGGAKALLRMFPVAAIVTMVLPMILGLLTMGFGGKGGKEGSEGSNVGTAVDVSGQLGKRYLPSQASQLGGTLNEAYSAMVQPFTDVVKPTMDEFGATMNDQNPVVAAVTTEMANLAAVLPIDEYGLMVNGMDTTMNAQNEAREALEAYSASIQPFKEEMAALKDITPIDEFGLLITGIDTTVNAQNEAQAKIMEAADNWVTDINENTGAQTGSYDLLLTGTDLAAKALERQAKVIDEANTNWDVGSTQSKNQWMSTASFAHDTVVEASDKVVNILAKGEMERAMGSLSGAMQGTADNFLMMFDQDAKALKDAADKQKAATIAFETMTQTVMNGYTQDRADAKAQREEIGTALLGADNPMLAYLTSDY